MKIPGFLLMGFNLFFVACTLVPAGQKDESHLFPPKALLEASSFLQKGQAPQAHLKIEEYLNKGEEIKWYGYACLLKASAFEMESKNKESIKFYRKAIAHGSQYNGALEAQALYKLSFVYEKLGHRRELLASLRDLMERGSFFKSLQAEVETPARLAAVYAAQGREKEGIRLHQRAARNYNRGQRGDQFQSSLKGHSKVLYYLGYSTMDESQESFQNLLKKLSRGQKYFLASAEISQTDWSKKALYRLERDYNRLWHRLLWLQPKEFKQDSLAYRKQKQNQQLHMASSFYSLVQTLEVQHSPRVQTPSYSEAAKKLTKSWLNKLEAFVESLDLGPETLRTQKIKNTKLPRLSEEKPKEVLIHKENLKKPMKKSRDEPKNMQKKKKAPQPPAIGKDPNL